MQSDSGVPYFLQIPTEDITAVSLTSKLQTTTPGTKEILTSPEKANAKSPYFPFGMQTNLVSNASSGPPSAPPFSGQNMKAAPPSAPPFSGQNINTSSKKTGSKKAVTKKAVRINRGKVGFGDYGGGKKNTSIKKNKRNKVRASRKQKKASKVETKRKTVKHRKHKG
jgi:hypothetical protein